jgi:O-antigen ligase
MGAIVGIFYEIRNRLSEGARMLYYIFSVGLIFLLWNGVLTSIAFQLSGSASEEVYAKRFHRIGEKLVSFETGSKSENYVDERWGLVVDSFNAFLDNPVFGVGYMAGNKLSELEKYNVGTHSEICDSLAEYGMIGCFFLFGYFILSFKRTNRGIKNKSYLVTLFIMALMNPFQYFHGFYVLFVLIPFINLLLIRQKDLECRKN